MLCASELVPLICPAAPVNNPLSALPGKTGIEIAIQSSDELEQLRTRLRKMTDAQ